MPAPDDQPRLGRRPALDGLRAFAVLLVLGHHTGKLLLEPSLGRHVLPGGFLGVDVFFVLSGFLITALLLERRHYGPHPLRAFYARRVVRLMPALAVLVLGAVAIALLEHEPGGQIGRMLWTVLTYTANWDVVAGTFPERHVAHLWSLSVEAQFYLVWPLLLGGLIALGLRGRRLFAAVLGLALLAAVLRAIWWEPGYKWLALYIRTDTRADALLIGAALALAPWDRLVPPRARTGAGVAALAAIVAVALLVDPPSRGYYLGLLTVVAVLAAVAIAALLPGDGALARALASRPALAVGVRSYSLYLWHFPLFVVVADHGRTWPGAARVVVAWAMAFVMAAFSYRFVEQPALSWRRRRAAARRGAAGHPRSGHR